MRNTGLGINNVVLPKLSENFDDEITSENTKEKRSRFYSIAEEAVITMFKKKGAFKSEEKKLQKRK